MYDKHFPVEISLGNVTATAKQFGRIVAFRVPYQGWVFSARKPFFPDEKARLEANYERHIFNSRNRGSDVQMPENLATAMLKLERQDAIHQRTIS
jgi:hypothetical protein